MKLQCLLHRNQLILMMSSLQSTRVSVSLVPWKDTVILLSCLKRGCHFAPNINQSLDSDMIESTVFCAFTFREWIWSLHSEHPRTIYYYLVPCKCEQLIARLNSFAVPETSIASLRFSSFFQQINALGTIHTKACCSNAIMISSVLLSWMIMSNCNRELSS